MSTLALSPVSAGVYAALNVSSITTLLAAGALSDLEVPEGIGFPRVWFTVRETNARGLGRGGLRRIDLRVYTADRSAAGTAEGVKTLQAVQAAVVVVLEDATLTITGYRQAGEVVYVDTTDPTSEVIAGVQAKESASHFYFWVEPS